MVLKRGCSPRASAVYGFERPSTATVQKPEDGLCNRQTPVPVPVRLQTVSAFCRPSEILQKLDVR